MAESETERPIVIAGNWKMNLGPTEAQAFFRDLRVAQLPDRVRLLIFPPALSLAAAGKALEPMRSETPPISLGVQNIHWEASGALTGELSAEMVRDAGATHVLVGHSERRQVFGETDQETALKVEAARRAGITPVFCVGETLEERRKGRLEPVLHRQLDAVLGPEDLRAQVASGPFLVAYEPVWAIGTGETATPEDAAGAHASLRAHLDERLGAGASSRVSILYGGSVKPENAADLLAAEGVDGVLVGGASLEPQSFAAIAEASAASGR